MPLFNVLVKCVKEPINGLKSLYPRETAAFPNLLKAPPVEPSSLFHRASILGLFLLGTMGRLYDLAIRVSCVVLDAYLEHIFLNTY